MMKSRDQWIKDLDMQAHPEGGWYRKNYRSPYQVRAKEIGRDEGEDRMLASTIYFLIDREEFSHFHELAADEVWFFHDGMPLTLSMIFPDGSYEEAVLGLDVDQGQLPQRLVPAGTIFAARVQGKDDYCLSGCMVSYGFSFEDFILHDKKSLLARFPQHQQAILKMALD